MVSAHCRCWCGCERIDRQLNDATSSWLVCTPCILDRHKAPWWECPTCGHTWAEKPESTTQTVEARLRADPVIIAP